MKLSIVIPVLDEAAQIEPLLRELSALRADGCEVIVVDGGSSDGTPALAAPLADRVLQTPRGRACQMNAGAALARADLLLFLHADTRLPPDALALLQARMKAGGHAWGRFDVQIEGSPRMLRVIAALMNLRSRITGIATGDQAIFVRRAAFDVAGGFPEQPLMEDIALSQRLKRVSPPLCLRAKVRTSGRRWERNGIWRTIWLMWSLRLRYWLGAPANRLARAYR
jgi:rSAM/selenodomain-associated transferase 2